MELVGVVDEHPERADAIAKEFGCRAFGSIEQLVRTNINVQAASVAVPTIHHLDTASQLMQAGIDVLIEKPLTPSLAEADDLIDVAKKTRRIAQVGHLERFNPAVRATVPFVTRPMFFEIHRLSVFTPRSLDVDVVLDLMIHDLDAVLSFVNSPIREIRAAGLPILSNKVDIANARIEFESGCIANFTASRVSTERVRKLRFFHRLRPPGCPRIHRRQRRRRPLGEPGNQNFEAPNHSGRAPSRRNSGFPTCSPHARKTSCPA